MVELMTIDIYFLYCTFELRMNDEKTEKTKKKAKVSVRDAYASLGEEFGQIKEDGKRERQEAIRDGITRIESEKKNQIFESRLVSDQISELRKEANMSSSVGTSGQISQPRMFGKNDFRRGCRPGYWRA